MGEEKIGRISRLGNERLRFPVSFNFSRVSEKKVRHQLKILTVTKIKERHQARVVDLSAIYLRPNFILQLTRYSHGKK